MDRQIPILRLIAFAVVWAVTPAIQADSLTVNLVQSDLTGAPGTTVDFFATILNPSFTDTVYLNGDSSSTSSFLLTLDDTPFFINAPLFLTPGESSGPFELFDIIFDPSTPSATYSGNVFSILGGPDGGTFSDFTDLADVPFSVTVATPTATTPEPREITPLLCGLLLGVGVFRWRRNPAMAAEIEHSE